MTEVPGRQEQPGRYAQGTTPTALPKGFAAYTPEAQYEAVMEMVELVINSRRAARRARWKPILTAAVWIITLVLMGGIVWFAYQGVYANLDGRIYP